MQFRPFAQRAAACALVVLAAIPQTTQAQSPTLPAELQGVRKLLDKYNDPIVAVHDGYLSTVGCISISQGWQRGRDALCSGRHGCAFLHMAAVGPTLDPAKPQVLIYEPVGDKLRLVAAEWFVPLEVAGGKALDLRQELEGPMEGHQPLMPAGAHHYDLHVWLWKTNAEGVFSPTNPAIKCPKGAYSFSEDAPKMVHPHR